MSRSPQDTGRTAAPPDQGRELVVGARRFLPVLGILADRMRTGGALCAVGGSEVIDDDVDDRRRVTIVHDDNG